MSGWEYTLRNPWKGGIIPSSPRKDPSLETISSASSTSPLNHSLARTSTCPIPSPPLLTVNPPTWCNNSSTKFNAFYIRKIGQMLLKLTNGHRPICIVVNSDLLLPIHIQSLSPLFRNAVYVIHKLPNTTPDFVGNQLEIAYQLVLQSRQSPGINIQ